MRKAESKEGDITFVDFEPGYCINYRSEKHKSAGDADDIVEFALGA